MVGGCVLMAFPTAPCVDCDDEVTTDSTPVYSDDSISPEVTDG